MRECEEPLDGTNEPLDFGVHLFLGESFGLELVVVLVREVREEGIVIR